MLKNKKGITILALMITVIVLLILTGVSVNMGFSIIKNVRAGRLISNMAMVRAKAQTIYEKYQFDGTSLVGKEWEIIEISDEEERLINTTGVWRRWDSDTLKDQGLDPQMLGEKEYFLVDYENDEIIYSRGTSLDGKTTYHSLTGLQHMLENNEN